MDVEKVKPLLRAVVQSNKGGVVAHRFNGEFRGIMGEDVPFRKLGFSSLNAFIETIPDTIRIGRAPDGELTYFAVADASTAHIQRMVAAQKSKKKMVRSKPSKGYLRKPAYKASWSTRSSPGMRPVQRPLATRNFTGSRMPQYGHSHTTHAMRSPAARPSHALQMVRSSFARPHPSPNAPSQFMRSNLAGPRTSQNTQSLPMRSSLAGPRNTQSHMTHNNFVVSRPSQPSSVTRHVQTYKPSQQASSDTAPYPTQRQTVNDTAPYPTQRQASSDTAPYPTQRQTVNDTAPYPQQRQTSSDTAPYPTQKAQQKLMRNYAAPLPQQESVTNCVKSQETSRQISLFLVQTDDSSTGPPETKEPTSPSTVMLQRRIPSTHITPSRGGRATVTKSRLFTRALNQAVTTKPPKRPVSSTDPTHLHVQFDRIKLSPKSDGIRASSTDTRSQSIGLQITVKGQEDVPTEIVKYGKTYKIPPRFQRMEKLRNLENSDVQLIFNDDPTENYVTDDDTSPLSPQLTADRISLSAKERLGSSSPPVVAVKPNIDCIQFKKMLANYLQNHGLPAQYETACVGTAKNPDRYVSSIEINRIIFGSLHVFPSSEEAEDKAAENACYELGIVAKDEDASKKKKGLAAKTGTTTVTPESNIHAKVKQRVKEIALKHVSGLWSAQLPAEYRATYWEDPPANLLSLIEDWTDIVKLELMAISARKIMYPVTEEKAIRLVQHSKMEHYEVPSASIPQPDATITVLISHLVDCSHFYVQCADSTINEIMEGLAEIYTVRGGPKTLLKPEPGLFCVAKYEDDNWYRARILAVHTTPNSEVECEVMYIDFGNCDVVPASKILRILESSCREPAQAIRCSLHGVFPAQGDTWSEDATNFFFNLSMETELKMDVIESDETSCSVVLRNMTDGSTDISINRQMVLDGVVASMEPPPLELPENSDWPVLVTSVKMTTEVTVRLVGPDHSDKLEDLEESLSCLADAVLHEREAHVDGVYAVCTTDGEDTSWGRVRVTSVKGREYEVLFLDHADTDVVSRDALRPLSRELNQLPYQALSCKLTGLEAYEKDQNVIDRLVELALGKTCVAAVDDRLDKVSLTLWDTSSDEDVNINETAAKVLKTEDLTPKLPVRGRTIEVYVSCVTLQGDIYIQCQGPGLQQLEQVADHIEQQYGKAGSASAFVSSPQVSQLCIAKNSNSGNWYRAEVTKVLPGRMVEVRFVDHGIIDVIHYRYLRDLPEGSHLCDLPYQAIRCQLYGLPPEGNEWTGAVLDRLVELMPPDELRVLEVVVAAVDSQEGEEGRELAQVEVYEIGQDGELMAVSETVTQEEDLWVDSEVFEDASSEPYVSPRVGEMNDDPHLQPDTPSSMLSQMGGISIATH